MLGKGPKWFWTLIYRVLESGNVEGEKRWSIDACLYFYHVFLSSFLFYHLIFLCSLVLSFFLSLLFVSLPLFMVTSLPFILLDSMGYLSFVPRASPTIFGFLWASLEDCPLTCWLPGHYPYLKCSYCTTPHPWKKFLVLFLLSLNSCLPQWMRIGGSLYVALWHASSGPSPLLASFRWNAILVRHFPKWSLDRNLRTNSLSSTGTKPHPLNPLIEGSPLLYWLGTSGWCSSPCVNFTTLCACPLLLPHHSCHFHLVSFYCVC